VIRWYTPLIIALIVAPVGGQERQSRTIQAKVTAYCPCRICCGPKARGVTSTGTDARRPGCAVDPQLIPYGSRVTIPGAGTVTADDTGGAMRQDARRGIVHVDLRMRTHEAAREWGVKVLEVEIK